jgi:hypothetical protein
LSVSLKSDLYHLLPLGGTLGSGFQVKDFGFINVPKVPSICLR